MDTIDRDRVNYCDCEDCINRERPCAFDCTVGDDDECQACREIREAHEEVEQLYYMTLATR